MNAKEVRNELITIRHRLEQLQNDYWDAIAELNISRSTHDIETPMQVANAMIKMIQILYQPLRKDKD